MSTNTEDERNQTRRPGDLPAGASNTNPACDQCRTRKIRCDREAPSCSNCRKANLPCDFTNKGKRINHTKQLVEDFSFLSGRLESIDASIARITQRLDLESLSSATSPVPQLDPAVPNDDLTHFTRHDSTVTAFEPSDAPSPSNSWLPSRTSFYITRAQDGSETYHGPTAGRSLFQQTRTFVEDLLDNAKEEVDDDDDTSDDEYIVLRSAISNDPTLRTELRKTIDAFPYATLCAGANTSSDGRLVSRPPQSFVESSMDFYLEEINTVLPLFDEQHLRAAVKEQYGLQQKTATSDAWSLCFNNIIVLVMGTKLKTALSMNVRRKDLEEDIFLPFLSNSYRAFNSLDNYSAPRLINVQALITLAMVAADHFAYGVFETLVHKACALGREMGLERFFEPQGPATHGIALERRRVFWSLYVLDKRRTFLTGKPCDLYLAESDLETPKDVPDEMWSRMALARIHMMSIWEEIWKNLYSSRAMRNSAKFREEQINRLRKYLKNWVTHHKPILCKPEQVEMSNATCMRLELRYSFHVAQILVHRCLDRSTNLQQQVNNARAALKIIADIYKGPATVGGTGLLSRLFRTYPVLAFYEIHRRTMQFVDEESKEDMELLRTCIDAMDVFKSPVAEDNNFNRLSAGLNWCMNIATLLRRAQDRPHSPPALSRNASVVRPTAGLLTRRSTGKRNSESIDDDLPMTMDPRQQKRRTSPSSSGSSLALPQSSMGSSNASQGDSTGPGTPASGYFTEFNQIDPLYTDPSGNPFAMNHVPSPPGELGSIPEIPLQVAPVMGNVVPMPMNKDQMNWGFAFNYPQPLNGIQTARSTTSQGSPPQLSSDAVSPRSSVSTDLATVVARLPPEGQQALTSMPPHAEYQPDSFSAFSTDLLDDSFINVGQHQDLIGGHPQFSNYHFDYATDYHHYGGPMEMMHNDGF